MTDSLQIYVNAETKLAVVEALAALLEDTDIEKVTVDSLCERANISRSTFYRNFDNKEAVTQWHLQFVHSQSTDEIGRSLSFYNGYLLAEMMLSRYESLYESVAQHQLYNSLSRFATETREKALRTTLQNYHHQRVTPQLEFEIEALVAMEIAMLPQWRIAGVSLEDKCHWLTDLVPRTLFRLINEPVRPSMPSWGAPGRMPRTRKPLPSE
ncbi:MULTISPECIES: TetR/AcrR family transcriptional regulator [unclassified Adlercreutzia]|uniref:TetR/AcrR family transcriptional regulator n=1 Tax=unclassified Adlercreutzia TaxID=2636013 RepID=UPI0013EC1F89|nr:MULTISPECIES: TetR/AcrR family transcriptional regulator [unclassified Adlercreutzia]